MAVAVGGGGGDDASFATHRGCTYATLSKWFYNSHLYLYTKLCNLINLQTIDYCKQYNLNFIKKIYNNIFQIFLWNILYMKGILFKMCLKNLVYQ